LVSTKTVTQWPKFTSHLTQGDTLGRYTVAL